MRNKRIPSSFGRLPPPKEEGTLYDLPLPGRLCRNVIARECLPAVGRKRPKQSHKALKTKRLIRLRAEMLHFGVQARSLRSLAITNGNCDTVPRRGHPTFHPLAPGACLRVAASAKAGERARVRGAGGGQVSHKMKKMLSLMSKQQGCAFGETTESLKSEQLL
jgi:hypothetical protein